MTLREISTRQFLFKSKQKTPFQSFRTPEYSAISLVPSWTPNTKFSGFYFCLCIRVCCLISQLILLPPTAITLVGDNSVEWGIVIASFMYFACLFSSQSKFLLGDEYYKKVWFFFSLLN